MENYREIYQTIRTCDNSVKIKVLKHNMEVAFLHEYLDKILEVYNTYAGKRVGEKTKGKIRTAINELLGDNAIAFIDYSGLHYTLHHYTWETVWFGWDKESDKRFGMWDKDGKLNRFTPKMFTIDKEYIENVDSYIETKAQKVTEIRNQANRLMEMCKEYNSDLCDGLKSANMDVLNLSYFRLE